jgi:hypothetical protein
MIRALIIAGILLLLAGRLRRLFFAAWRFTFPGLAGAVLALLMSARVVSLGAPKMIVFIAPVMAFFMIGAAGKQWFDSNLGPPRR